MDIYQQLARDEGRRLTPYLDCCGKPWRECTCAMKGHLTIGVGRNLDAVGLRDDEVDVLLRNDVLAAVDALRSALPWTDGLDDARRGVLLNMTFNLGMYGLLKFEKMLAACERHEYDIAANEMLDSTWATQVGARAARLAEQMRTGRWT